ncbi:DUF7793 family protein [Actinomycetospora soli]|uniref:DUF7793 family protein n=1 Tax=Actinomycetospora soli TaxID=2893887 RepID=UPI001E525A94|nr:hypothetical protein [Actinomycetospora soli]MCD2187994.1 hypothetical protein [Actinomycetospora soli]
MSSDPTLGYFESLHVDALGVVRLEWVGGLRITGDIAEQAMAAVDELNGPARRPMIVMGSAPTTRAAREVFGRECSVTRIAMVGRSAVDRTIANFSLFVDPPAVPTRFFTDEAAALDWLLDDRARG